MLSVRKSENNREDKEEPNVRELGMESLKDRRGEDGEQDTGVEWRDEHLQKKVRD